MESGPIVNDTKGLESVLGDTKTFFIELQKYFDREIKVLGVAAQADVRYVTSYFDKVALVNIAKSLEKLENPKPKNSETKVAEKVIHYLTRTREFLAKTTQNNVDAALFIPVQIHTRKAKEDQELLAKCDGLLERAKTIISNAQDNKKTWLPYHISLANILADAYAAAFGLEKDKRKEALERLESIKMEVELPVKDIPITKTSKKFTGCETYSSEPTAEEFYQYVPKLNPRFDAFKEAMKMPKEELNAKVMHEALGKGQLPSPK